METRAGEQTSGLKGDAAAPVAASVVAVKLQDFARRPVTEQARLKGELEALVAGAIGPLGAADRIVLEALDALVVVVLARPQAALELAERCEAAAGALPLCIGVNHGPVRRTSDPLRGAGVVGDGVATAMVLAEAATPGRLLASRPFHEALEATHSRRAADLAAAGELTDASVRRHELYALQPRSKQPSYRRAAVMLVLGSMAIVGLPFLARRFPAGPKLDTPVAPRRLAQAAAQRVEPQDEPKTEPPAPPPPPKPKPAPPKPASIRFKVRPHGFVYVDGVGKGRTPPLTRLELKPGKHSVEVRSGRYPPLRLQVNLSKAEEMTITHTFLAPRPPARPREEGLVSKFRRKLRELAR